MIHAWPALLLLSAQPAGGAQPDRPAFERPVEIGRGGRVAVRLDREVYESARPDLGDLRVIDEAGRRVPFLIDRGERPALRSEEAASLRNQGWDRDGSATAVLDFGSRVRKTRLRLALSGDNFRRRVSVEASDDGTSWTTIVDEAWVFAVPGADAARYETVALPENDFPLLRLTVHPGEGERARVLVVAAAVPASGEPPRREDTLRPQWARAEDVASGETWLTLDLGARHQPFHADRARGRRRALLPRGARRGAPGRPAGRVAAALDRDRPRRDPQARPRRAEARVPDARRGGPRARAARPAAQR